MTNFFQNFKLAKIISFWPWLLLFLVWFSLEYFDYLNDGFLAGPTQIIRAYSRVSFWQLFGVDLFYTLALVFSGVIIGYLISYLWVFIELQFDPKLKFWLQAQKLLQYFPPPLLIPVGVLMFGLGYGAKLFILSFSFIVLFSNHIQKVIVGEELKFRDLQLGWGINSVQRFRHFIVPLSNKLSHRVWGNITLWLIAMALISEMLLSGEYGLGIRLQEFQILFQSDFLYGYIFLLILVSILLEKFLVISFSRLLWSPMRTLIASLLILFGLISLGFSYQVLSNNNFDPQKTILTYTATANLPIFVYIEKFNNLDLDLKIIESGKDALSEVFRDKAVVSGYNDLPNLLSGQVNNDKVLIAGQVNEVPDNPAIFLISPKAQEVSELKNLEGGTIAYYPNNPLIQKGLEFYLSTVGVNTSQIEFQSQSDPINLNSALVADRVDAVLTIEPFVKDLEDKLDLKRVNPNSTLLTFVDFEYFPLGALSINTGLWSDEKVLEFLKNLNFAYDYIEQNTDSNSIPKGPLRPIMEKYNLNPDSRVPNFTRPDEINSDDLNSTKSFLNLFSTQLQGFDNIQAVVKKDNSEFYLDYESLSQ